MSLEMLNHTHKLQSSLIHQKVTMRPYHHEEICKITHTDRSCSQVVNLACLRLVLHGEICSTFWLLLHAYK
jgi:Cdc6-like AAA superfamily ATPase